MQSINFPVSCNIVIATRDILDGQTLQHEPGDTAAVKTNCCWPRLACLYASCSKLYKPSGKLFTQAMGKFPCSLWSSLLCSVFVYTLKVQCGKKFRGLICSKSDATLSKLWCRIVQMVMGNCLKGEDRYYSKGDVVLFIRWCNNVQRVMRYCSKDDGIFKSEMRFVRTRF